MCITLNVKTLLNPKGGCMKKLLVLALVLSMASMASAALVIGTSTSGPLAEGETAALTISTDAPMGFGLGDWNGAAIVVDLSKAMITGGVSLYPTEPGIAVFADAAVDLGFVVPTFPVENGVGFTFTFTGANIAASTIIDSLVYTAGSYVGDVTITLYGSQDYLDYTNLGSIVINQIPEPITMTLLGLGGLFLRRRSK
jgi:hypothetical protein